MHALKEAYRNGIRKDIEVGNIEYDSLKRVTKKDETILSKRLWQSSEEERKKLEQSVLRIMGGAKDLEYGLPYVLRRWFDVYQLAKILDVSINTIFTYGKEGGIKSFVNIGAHRMYHPLKAMKEFIAHEKKVSERIRKKRLKTRIEFLTKQEFLALVEFIREETGHDIRVEKGNGNGVPERIIDKVFNICKEWYTVRSLMGILAVSKETVRKIIRKYKIRMFRLKGAKELILISPKGFAGLEREIEEFLGSVRKWHKKALGRDAGIKGLEDFRRWVRLSDMKGVFPFVGKDAFAYKTRFNRYLVRDALFVSPGVYIPPCEIERLKKEAISWLTNKDAFKVLKGYGLVQVDAVPGDIGYEDAVRIIMEIQRDWFTVEEFAGRTGKTVDTVRNRIEEGRIDCVKLGMFERYGILYLPPQAGQEMQALDAGEVEKAKRFLRDICGISVMNGSDVYRMLDEYCMTSAQVARRLGLKKIIAASSHPNTIVLKFTGSSPEVYWKKEDAEAFIENEKRKFNEAKAFVSRYSDVSGVKSARDLIELLDREWKTAKEIARLLRIKYRAVMHRIYMKGDFISVTLNLAGFGKRVYIWRGKGRRGGDRDLLVSA